MRLPDFITDRLYDRVWSIMGSRPSDVAIGLDETGRPYMQRWHAIRRNRFLNIYLHLYLHDDERILHSHPWWSLSIMLHGSLVEYSTPTAEGANDPHKFRLRVIDKGEIVIRDADMFHRLEVSAVRTVTIFITGPKFKTWYFACKRGLMHWRDFVSPGRGGQGCGEDDSYPTNR